MKSIVLIIQLCLIIIFPSCNNPKSTSSNNFLNIDIEHNIDNLEVIRLSQFSDNISYVPLETKDYFYIDAKSKCIFSDSLILIYDLSGCALYNSNGKFLTRIGTKGNGPQEFQFCVQACFSDHASVYLQSSLYDLFEYALDGTFIKKYDDIFRIDKSDDKFIYNWGLVDDSLFFCHVPNSTGQIEYKSLIINKQGKKKQIWKNYDQFARKGTEFGFEREAFISFFEKSMFFKQFFNDTLFLLNNKKELVPKYSFSLGKLKMPVEVRARHFGGKELWSYIFIYDILQTDDYLFLNCGFGNRFPAKRLTPLTKNPQMGPTWYNTTFMLGVVDKNSGDIKFSKPTSTDNPLFTTGIYNDIDAGPRFYPNFRINDSTLAMLVDANELIVHLNSNDFKDSAPIYPEKKKELERMTANLSGTDNPVLMIVSFKK